MPDEVSRVQPVGERRANIRLNRVLAADFLLKGEWLRRLVVDVSATGFRVASHTRLVENSACEVRLHLKNGLIIQATARVVWVEQLSKSEMFEIGFGLEEVRSEEDFQHLLKFLDKEFLVPAQLPVVGLKQQISLRAISPAGLNRLAALAGICELFNSTYRLEEVLDRSLRVLVEVTGAERGMLLLDRGGKKLDIPAIHSVIPDPKKRYSTSVLDEVSRSGGALISLDVAKDDRLSQSASLKLMKTRSVLCVPVTVQGRDFGFLYLDDSVKAGVFTDAELHFASVIAGLAAAAIERAQSFSLVLQNEKMAALGTMVAGVVHELNSPLSSILNIAELLADGGTDLADPLLQEVHRCCRFVQQILSTARAGDAPEEPVDLRKVVDDAVPVLSKQFALRGVELLVDLDSLVPLVLGQAERLRQVVLNLLSNALHEVKERRGRVEVRVSSQQGRVYLSVLDNGSGIEAQNLPKIFDPFFTTKPAGIGTGLGLSIIQRIVYDHGGTIQASSNPGGGALFLVELPAHGSGEAVELTG